MELIGKLLAKTGLYDKIFVDITNLTFMFSFVYFIIPSIVLLYVVIYIAMRLRGNAAMSTATTLTSAILMPFAIIALAYYLKPSNVNIEEGQLKFYNQNEFEYKILYQEGNYYELDTPKGLLKANNQIMNDLKNRKAFLAKSRNRYEAAVVYVNHTYTARLFLSNEMELVEANAVVDVFMEETDELKVNGKQFTVRESYKEIY